MSATIAAALLLHDAFELRSSPTANGERHNDIPVGAPLSYDVAILAHRER